MVVCFISGEGKMHEILLFNIGFRCEAMCKALKDYMNEGVKISKLILEDSIEVITDCFMSEKGTTSFFSSHYISTSEFLPIIIEIFPDKEIKDIFEELAKIRTLLENLENKQEIVNVDLAYQFFKKVSTLCLRRNARPQISSLFKEEILV